MNKLIHIISVLTITNTVAFSAWAFTPSPTMFDSNPNQIKTYSIRSIKLDNTPVSSGCNFAPQLNAPLFRSIQLAYDLTTRTLPYEIIDIALTYVEKANGINNFLRGKFA